jgi:hypothetical protein
VPDELGDTMTGADRSSTPAKVALAAISGQNTANTQPPRSTSKLDLD